MTGLWVKSKVRGEPVIMVGGCWTEILMVLFLIANEALVFLLAGGVASFLSLCKLHGISK